MCVLRLGIESEMAGHVVKVKREALVACMTCPLCHKLLKEATTISLCLHTFCRKCILEKLSDEEGDCYPVCEIDLGCMLVEKLRPDHNLQDIRAKIFPLKRRKINAPESPSVSLPVKRKERSLSSLVVSTRKVPVQAGLTGKRPRALTRKAASLRECSFYVEGTSKREESSEDHPRSSCSPDAQDKLQRKMGKRKDSWRHNEEAILCQAWITITTDGATGTNQSADTMWERISAEYNAQKPATCVERSSDSCKARWKVFSPLCTKWRESLTQAEVDHRSGENKEDDLMRARSIFYDKVGTDFVYDHCWRYLKSTIKFGETPSTEAMNSRIPTPINLEEDEAHANEAEPTTTRQARPQGQKAQKLAKKKGKQQDADGLRIQMQKAQEQSEREYLQRQQQFEQVKQLEQRASDDRIMMVDLSTFDTPRKRGYWERRQQEIINREEATSRSPVNPQDKAPTEYQTPTEEDNRNLTNYVPVHETQWMN